MASEKIILGIDPGTTIMGFGLIRTSKDQMELIQMHELQLSKYSDHYLKLKQIYKRTLEIIGAFLGAFAGELLRDSQGKKKALKAAIGSLIGFLTGVFLKFSVTIVYVFFFVQICFEHII